MKSPHDMTVKERIVATVIIVLAALFGIALWGWLSGGWNEGENEPLFEIASSYTRKVKADIPEPCMNEEMRERLRMMALTSLDASFGDKVEQLYAVWLRDATDQPARAQVGIKQAISAYLRAHDLMEKWSPPECPAG